MERIIRTTLEIGLAEPVKLLHMTDVHLVEYAEDDDPEQIEHMKKRRTVFEKEAGFPPHTQNEYFEEGFRIAAAEGAFPIVTGDVMDVLDNGNLTEFHRITDGKDFMFCPGSHDFARFCRTPGPEYPGIYREARARVEASFPQRDLTFESRVIGGVNLITMDNSQDYFPAEVLERLRGEEKKGLPMVLFMHDPLHDHGLLRVRPMNPAMGRTPQELLISDTVLGFLARCPLVAAAFSGHWHGEAEAVAPCGVRTFVTPGLFKGVCRLIELK